MYMKDIFKKYHRHKIITRISLLSLSVILAVSINVFMLSWNNATMLKASILDVSQKSWDKIDFQWIYKDTILSFSTNKAMQNVTQFSYSLAYNPDEIIIWDTSSIFVWENVRFEENSWYITVIFTPKTPINFNTWDVIHSYEIERIDQLFTWIINVVNANFTDIDENTYLLTTEWIIF
jgi:predicted membrane protein